MADDLNKRGPQDRSRINTSEQWELMYWSERLGVSPDQIKEAVKEVGTNVDAVENYLARHQGAAKR